MFQALSADDADSADARWVRHLSNRRSVLARCRPTSARSASSADERWNIDLRFIGSRTKSGKGCAFPRGDRYTEELFHAKARPHRMGCFAAVKCDPTARSVPRMRDPAVAGPRHRFPRELADKAVWRPTSHRIPRMRDASRRLALPPCSLLLAPPWLFLGCSYQ